MKKLAVLLFCISTLSGTITKAADPADLISATGVSVLNVPLGVALGTITLADFFSYMPHRKELIAQIQVDVQGYTIDGEISPMLSELVRSVQNNNPELSIEEALSALQNIKE